MRGQFQFISIIVHLFLLRISVCLQNNQLGVGGNKGQLSPGDKNQVVASTDGQTIGQVTTGRSTLTSNGPDSAKEPGNARSRLRSALLQNYSPRNPPVKEHQNSIKVDLGMSLIHISMNEQKSILETDIWMRVVWFDEHLAWSPEDYGGLTQIHFTQDEIWRPDIMLYNSAEAGHTGNYVMVDMLVFNTGQVLWVPPASFKSFCKIDLRHWPLESQSCKMKFGSWTSHGNQIDLGLYHNMTTVEKLNFYTDNQEWKVLETSVKRNVAYYECCKEPYPDITFTFKLQRSSQLYRCAIILPCLVTMLLVVSSFMLPPASGEKITINATSLAVCVLYLIYFCTAIPPLSDSVPLIVLFYSNTSALVGIAILLNVCCISMCREQRYRGPPKCLTTMFSGLLGKALSLDNYYHQVSPTHQRLVTEMDSYGEDCSSNGRRNSVENRARAQDDREREGERSYSIYSAEWRLVAVGIERLFFVIYTLAFAVVSVTYL